MSKAFVIKNKQDNRYLVVYNFYGDENYKLGELYDATLFSNLELANETKTRVEPYNYNNFELEVVEITIAEGDLEQQLAEKDNLIKEINQAYIETYKREREKDKEIEKLKNFMSKWHFENFESFENHYNYLMSLKNREQLMVENEAMKETIANLLGQKKTSSKEIRHQICEEIREKVDSIVWDDAETVYNEINEIIDKIKQGE